jgi:hypothetical protein
MKTAAVARVSARPTTAMATEAIASRLRQSKYSMGIWSQPVWSGFGHQPFSQALHLNSLNRYSRGRHGTHTQQHLTLSLWIFFGGIAEVL